MPRFCRSENLLLTGERQEEKTCWRKFTGVRFRKTDVQRFLPCKYGKCRADRNDTFRTRSHTPEGSSIYRCAEEGGFGILDEINMAKNDAGQCSSASSTTAISSMCLPGYDKIPLHPAARMIGTMARLRLCGNRELNEALVSLSGD